MDSSKQLDIPKPYVKIFDGTLLELMEDYPPYLTMESARTKKREIKQELEIRVKVISHNGRFFLYRAISNKKHRVKNG